MNSSTASPALTMQHDAARLLEQADHFLDGVGADDLRALGFVGEEVVDLGDGAVEDGDYEAVVVHVEDEVLAHDGQADETDVSSLRHKVGDRRLMARATGASLSK